MVLFFVLFSMIINGYFIYLQSRFNIKKLLLGNEKIFTTSSKTPYIVGSLCFVIFICLLTSLKLNNQYLYCILIGLILITYMIAIPLIFRPFVNLVKYIGKKIQSSYLLMIANNLLGNIHVNFNITLIVIGLACFIVIHEVGNATLESMTNTYADYNYEIEAFHNKADSLVSEIEKLSEVEQVLPIKMSSNVKLDSNKILLHGYRDSNYLKFFNLG